MKNQCLVLLLILIAIPCFSQQQNQQRQIKISGKIIDQDTKEPLEYATISFYSPRQKKIVNGGITTTDGTFSIEIQSGMYTVIMEYISFKTKKLQKQKLIDNTDLGVIALSLDTESLDDVLIIAEKTTVEIKLDKKIYNVGQDLTVSGGTVSDVLDNVPSVSVDVEGNVALRDNDNVTVLINGKPSGLVGLNSTDALTQLPADAIERVEVITSPSARYDAEGTAGIINIILRRSKLQGLNGALTVNGGHPLSAGVSGNLNYRTGDLNFFTTSGYNYREAPGNSLAETFFIASENFLIEDREFDRIRNGVNVNVGVEWYINDSSSITSSFLYRFSDDENNTTNVITEIDADNNLENSIRFDPEIEDDTTKQYSLNYTKDFEKTGHKLTFDFQTELSSEEEDSRITQQNDPRIELVNTLEKQNRTLIQTDYVLPLGENSQFELGYRGNFNELDTEFLVQFDTSGLITVDNNLSNDLRYKEHINAVYTQFGNKTGKLSYLLGIRVENTKITIDQKTNGDFEKKDYTDVFPTINLGYEISEDQSFVLGYNRRISRPRNRFINPFPSRSSATNIFQGNPDLDPSYSNAFDLGYLNRIGKLTLNSSIYYNRSTQVFTFISEDTGDVATIGTNADGSSIVVPVIRRTPINLSNSDRYGFEFTTTYNPSRKWRLSANLNAFQNSIKGTFNEISLNADIFSWSARLNNKITLPKQIDWQMTAIYRGPNENAQTKSEGIFSMNLAFSKDLFKEKASITFNVRDLFNSRKRISRAITETFTSYNEYQRRVRSFNLSFTYRFNQKKKRERSREDGNDGGDDFE
ncbi:outer membrane beta-barrel family protein [Aquimarina addita]|uniref:Outer membrane beta-barrel family protein n=1 Tax=Aquimarina addita TaxID=870485 RepID=A0ABP6UX57_9FLAO